MAAVLKPNSKQPQHQDLPAFLQRKIQFREAGSSSNSSTISYKRPSEKNNASNAEKEPLELSWKCITGIGPGLVNLGNTCFLNATLQCLWYTAPWTNYLRSTRHSQKCPRKEACVLCELEALTVQALPGKRPLAPQGIVARMKQVARHFRPYAQQDAHEYLRFLQDALNKCLISNCTTNSNSEAETTVLSRIFRGELLSSITCAGCGNASGTIDPFLDISLDLKKGVHSIKAALEAYSQPETLTTPYHCGKCRKALVGATKRMTLHTLPPVLTLHLKRFSSPYTKLTRPITFAPELTITNPNNLKSANQYALYAVLVHQGQTCSSGHYYSYVKAANNLWYEMDDSSVRQVSINTVLAQPAYILFYQKTNNTDSVSNSSSNSSSSSSESELDVVNTKSSIINANVSVSSELDHFALMKPKHNSNSSIPSAKRFKNKKRSDSGSVTPVKKTTDSPIRKSPRANRKSSSFSSPINNNSASKKKVFGAWQIKSLK